MRDLIINLNTCVLEFKIFVVNLIINKHLNFFNSFGIIIKHIV